MKGKGSFTTWNVKKKSTFREKAFCQEASRDEWPSLETPNFSSSFSRGEMLGLRVCKSIANPVTNSKFATICTDLHACKLLVCTRGKLRGKCGNGREAVRRKSVANPLQTNYFATNLHACKLNANTKFASDLHIRKSADYIKLANGL